MDVARAAVAFGHHEIPRYLAEEGFDSSISFMSYAPDMMKYSSSSDHEKEKKEKKGKRKKDIFLLFLTHSIFYNPPI